jgi:hypothetical protein
LQLVARFGDGDICTAVQIKKMRIRVSTNAPQKLPKRSSRFGVGKEIGGAVYLHCKYERRLGNALVEVKVKLPKDFEYQVVKLNYRTKAVSFIQCDDFDTAPEPTVGNSLSIDATGLMRYRRRSRDPEIYHHKWLFVTDDYEGFDVEASRQRSLTWMRLDGVDRRRIGRASYWRDNVLPRLVSF